ncbi:MAG: hypothetical protein JJ863_34235 [Deltaproteobacteria bacterium]|nr:hypothetical protein [Deltaproteobacteria bacterium]
MGATLPTAGSRTVGGGSGGSTFDLHGGSRFALGGTPVVIGDVVGGVPTQTTSFFESNEEVVWVYDGTMLATLANAPQAYAVSADGSTAMRLRTNFAGISRTYATEKYRCAER